MDSRRDVLRVGAALVGAVAASSDIEASSNTELRAAGHLFPVDSGKVNNEEIPGNTRRSKISAYDFSSHSQKYKLGIGVVGTAEQLRLLADRIEHHDVLLHDIQVTQRLNQGDYAKTVLTIEMTELCGERTPEEEEDFRKSILPSLIEEKKLRKTFK
jgi:hypothetical protein